MSKKKTLVLVDGSSYLFRAFHALPPLTNSHGEPTGAVYGVMNMLKKLQAEYADAHFCVIFDAKGKNFRHEMYPAYKANRSEMPDMLVPQIAPLHALIQAYGFPLLSLSGVEADDVIGTLAVRGAAAGFNVIISTGDKDMAQLVNSQILLVNTMSSTTLDEQGVEAKFGVPPGLIVDYLALMGDPIDNVPGIPKVGPKTAAKWLKQYGTLDGLVTHAAEISGKIGETLREHLHVLPLSKALVTIRCDIELSTDIESLVILPRNRAELEKQLSRLEFKSWLNELKAEPVATPSAHYEQINTEASLLAYLDEIKKAGLFVFDLETTSLDVLSAEIVGIALCHQPGHAVYIPIGHDASLAPTQLNKNWVLQQLKPLWQDEAIVKCAHNLKYDMGVLATHELDIRGPRHDSMLESYVTNSVANRHDMDTLAEKYLQISTTSFEDVAGKGAKQITFDQVPLEKAVPYACEDAEVTLRLHHFFYPKIQEVSGLKCVYDEVEMPLVPVLSQMERWGVMLDKSALAQQSESLGKSIHHLQEQIFAMAGEEFNIDSPKQLQHILFNQLQLPILEKTPTGQPSTAESVLSDLAVDYELPALILEYRSLSKLKSTYTDKLPLLIHPMTHRIHTSFHQAVTATGRLSSSDPNLQNIPIRRPEGRAIRRAFIVPEGYQMLALDYSQIELRIMAHLSNDPTLLKAFAEDADIHQMTASEVFHVPFREVTSDQRRQAKAINFGLIYGMSSFGLAKQLGVTRDAAEQYMNIYFARYPGVKAYMENTRKQAEQLGYVETLMGRRLYLPEINARQHMRRMAAQRTAINAPMQGTAADIIKLAMIRVFAWLQKHAPDVKMLIQVHDELVFEVPETQLPQVQSTISSLMSDALSLHVPLVVSSGLGNNWEEAH